MDEIKLLAEGGGSPKLRLWQERLAKSNSEYSAEEKKMDERERLYNGDREMAPRTAATRRLRTCATSCSRTSRA